MTKTYHYLINYTISFLFLIVLFGCSKQKENQENKEAISINSDSIEAIKKADYVNWSIYKGDKKGNQFAELGQIHAANVHRLELAWQYRTGDADKRSSMQCNPIMINDLLYFSTPP